VDYSKHATISFSAAAVKFRYEISNFQPRVYFGKAFFELVLSNMRVRLDGRSAQMECCLQFATLAATVERRIHPE
jgi:hypothetical protein